MYDSAAQKTEADVREDEEQSVKLQQIVDLLLAAGYFRARIKGLSAFDKVVGGITWCISTCNYDVDVDLLFQENSTIGQRIGLTEKLVAVLPLMRCPHRIEPHQIQGLDFIHVYPVVQWLVKKAIATREEMGDYVRAYAVSQFHKKHCAPEDLAFDAIKPRAIESVTDVKTAYGPKRRYCRTDSSMLQDEVVQVESTLLEYGRIYAGAARKTDQKSDSSKTGANESAKSGEEEQKRIDALMSGMSATSTSQGQLAASAVGHLVALQSEQIQQIASQYAEQVSTGQTDRSSMASTLQNHQRVTSALKRQIEQQRTRLMEAKRSYDELNMTHSTVQQRLTEVRNAAALLDAELAEIANEEKGYNASVLQKLRSLVALNESLKQQEQQFRTHCKDELARLQKNIDEVANSTGQTDEQQERLAMIRSQYETDRERWNKIRQVLARKNREIAALQRKIDEVPSRAELSQYQRRFVELYAQVAAKYKETKQFFTLYNTLHDTKLYLNKQVNLLDSIHDNFEQALSSAANKDLFLKQFERIVEGVKQNKAKLERKKQEEKMTRDQLTDTHLALLEQQRLYFKLVRDFQQECTKFEIIQSQN